MGSVSKDLKTPYNTETFDDIINTYQWLLSICSSLGVDKAKTSSEFHYGIGRIFRTSDSFEDFVKNAFLHNINLIAICMIFPFMGSYVNFSVTKKFMHDSKNLSVTCDSTKEHAVICDAIEKMSKIESGG